MVQPAHHHAGLGSFGPPETLSLVQTLFTHMERYRDLGLLILRVGFGLSFFWFHGYPKLMGGPEMWARIGDAVANVGITFGYTAWGLAAA